MKTAIKNVLLMIFVIVISFAIKHYNSLAISASNTQDEKAYHNKLTKDNDNNQTKTKKANKSVLKQLQDQYLIIKSPKVMTFRYNYRIFILIGVLKLSYPAIWMK